MDYRSEFVEIVQRTSYLAEKIDVCYDKKNTGYNSVTCTLTTVL